VPDQAFLCLPAQINDLHNLLKGANATAEVLLPIAAVAVGMTVLGLVFHIIASGAL
jgi:hypothetical protein